MSQMKSPFELATGALSAGLSTASAGQNVGLFT